MPDLLLGLDVGTTSARAVIFDAEGKTIGSSQVALSNRTTESGHVEQDLNFISAVVFLMSTCDRNKLQCFVL